MLSKHLTNVIQNLEKKKFREKYNLYKVEGDKLVQELLLSDMKIDSLIARPSWIESNQQHVKKCNTIEVNEIEMGRISNFKTRATSARYSGSAIGSASEIYCVTTIVQTFLTRNPFKQAWEQYSG